MTVMALAFNGTTQMGQFLGDTIVSVKSAYLMAQSHPCSKYLLALSPKGELNFLWGKFIDDFHAEVVYDDFHPGNMDQRFGMWDRWFKEREIDGRKFDVYKELYRRIDGGHRQAKLCGGEKGLGRKNIFEYFYFGQENVVEPCIGGDHFRDDLIYHKVVPPDQQVLIAPYAKCQGNGVFTFQFWDKVVRRLVGSGVQVTVNHNGEFCEDLKGPLYRRIFPPYKHLVDEVARHRLVCCGNTGIGWVAGAVGVPLLACQPPDSNMQDYRYEWCGVRSMVEFLEHPDVDYCCKRIMEELDKRTVLTTGCYDILHAGHIRHLEESRSMGTRLIVALNSDSSIRTLKGAERPIHRQEEREAVLRALRCVDDVRLFDGDNAMSVIEDVKPAVLTNGCDHKLGEIVGKAYVEQYGGQVVVTTGTREASTTKTLMKAIKVVDIVKACRDGERLSPNPFHKLKLMADQFLTVLALPGDVADVGAYRGGCSLVLRQLAPDKNLHLFDSWAGNPHEDPLCHHRKGEWAASLPDVQKLLGVNGQTHYHQGVFPASAAPVKDRRFSFVFIDPDTYQTVRDAIAFFLPRMVEGGKMMFDDYGWEPCSGVKKAVDEAFTAEQKQVFDGEFACIIVK